VGSGLSYSLNSKGGSSTPSHTHTLDPPNTSTTPDGNHTHSVSGPSSSDTYNGATFSNRKKLFSGCEDLCNGYVISNNDHTHSVSSSGSHSHNLDIPSTTSGSGSITNNPKYHSLYYIIKL
jgi:hypothetical protein